MSLMSQKERSIANGAKIEVGDTIYMGRPPEYKLIGMTWVKVRKGVPYVKV